MQRHCHQTIASSGIRADIDVIKANCNQAGPGISSGLSDWPQAWQSLDYAIAFPIAMKHARSLPEHAQSVDGASHQTGKGKNLDAAMCLTAKQLPIRRILFGQ